MPGSQLGIPGAVTRRAPGFANWLCISKFAALLTTPYPLLALKSLNTVCKAIGDPLLDGRGFKCEVVPLWANVWLTG